jgi:magnesium-transporting ATPase (P-type)
MNENLELKNEAVDGSNDLVSRKSLRQKLKVHNFKDIMSITVQIFLQLFLALLITQINSFMFGWYDNRTYLSVINKITIFYTTFQFVPSLVASGVLIVGNNLIGQGKTKDLPKIIVSGVLVNLFFTLLVVGITNALSKEFFHFLDINNDDMISYQTEQWQFILVRTVPTKWVLRWNTTQSIRVNLFSLGLPKYSLPRCKVSKDKCTLILGRFHQTLWMWLLSL